MYNKLMSKLFILILFSFILISCDRSENTDKIVCNYGEHQSCTCNDGSDGKKLCKDNAWLSCECKTDELCKDVTCSNKGKCLVKSDKATCICDDGYHDEGLNCIKDGETNPCDNKTCTSNSHCTVEDNTAICVCNSDYILNSENICIFDCSNINNSHLNENNNACDCNDGYHSDNNQCVQDADFKCLNYDCNANAHCIIENNAPKCACNNGFVENNNICILDCSSIEHSHANNENSECLCDDTYHLESDLCESNEKRVSCNAVTVPNNAHQINVEFDIHWTEANGWEIPADCEWECDTNYQDNDNNQTCEAACSETSCEHGTCDDTSGMIDCTCDAGYQDNNGDKICLPDCESTKVNGVACGGNGTCTDDTGIINCICDSGYQDNDHNGSCKEKCHIDPLAPDLSTCGKEGTCNDASGEIVCSCNDGYFVNASTNRCVTPCEDIDCGKHGTCVALGLNNISCSCDGGYQDNNNNLICKKSCDSSCLTNSTACDDSNGELTCQCDTHYQDNDRDGTCLPDCTEVTCNDSGQILNSCTDSSGFAVCSYEQGYNYTNIISGSNEQIINDSAIDSNGNLYLVGSFKGTVHFDPISATDEITSSGEEDIFITRINADGSYAWTYHIGGSSSDGASAIAIDNYNNLYITGYFSSSVDFDASSSIFLRRSDGLRDIFIFKITNDGEFSWVQTIASQETEAVTSIKLDNTSIYLTGYLYGDTHTTITVDFDKSSANGDFTIKGRQDGFISKFNIIDGSYIWAKVFGVANMYNRALDVAVLNNDILITGYLYGDNIDFDESDDSQGTISTNNKPEAFILKLSKDNQFIWVKALEPQNPTDVSKGVKLEVINNNAYIIGNLQGSVDFDTSSNQDIVNAGGQLGIYIAKFDDDGMILDKEIFIATNSSSMIKDSFVYNNKLYLIGDIKGSLNIQGTTITNSSSDTNKNDVFFTTLDSNFSVENVEIFGGDLNDQGKSISISNNGEIYILGEFEGTSDFDPSNSVNNKTSLDLRDIFISRFTD